METAPKLYHVVNQAAGHSAGVDAFLDALRREQACFLDTIAGARSLLDGESGQFARFTATHGLLTRQFLDAQRSIMKRRAEIDAEVAMIIDEAGFTAETVDTRQLEPRITAAQRQLAALLDDWWRVENQDGRALVDAARARAAVRQPAEIEAGAAINRRSDVAAHSDLVPKQSESTQQLTTEILAALEAVDPVNLLSLLTTLADSFAPRPAETERHEEPPSDDLVIRLDRATSGMTPEDTFQEFWDEPAPREIARAAPLRHSVFRRTARSLAAHVVLPMTVVTSAVVLLMAWIG